MAQGVILEAPPGHVEQWQSEAADDEGTFNFSLRLLNMEHAEGEWLPSAHVGVSDRSGGKQFQVVLVHSKKGKGIMLGYKYVVAGSVLVNKAVLHGVPLNEILRVTFKVSANGQVSVQTVGLNQSFETGISKPYGIFGVSGARAEFFPAENG